MHRTRRDLRSWRLAPRVTLEAWERRSEWPMAVAAVIFLGAYAWPILQPDLAASLVTACNVVTWVVWAVFVVDYVARVALAEHRAHYVEHHLVDLLVIALPVLRPLRLLRLIVLLRVLNKEATTTMHGRVATYVTGAVAIILFVASLAELDAARGQPGSNIESFGDALWWSGTTVTTVGYGDHFPVTTTGKLVAVGLMLCGIALVGVVTASLATWLLEQIRKTERQTRGEVAELSQEVRTLRAAIETLGTGTVTRAEAERDPAPG